MFLSNVLESVKDYLETTGILSYDATRSYDVQLTPDERPFPSTGRHVVTLYGERLFRERVQSQQRKFTLEFELCLSQKLTRQPHDRQYKGLYTELITSLSNLGEILLFTLDNNLTLLNIIRNTIDTNISSISNSLSSMTTSTSEGITDEIIDMLSGAEVIGPLTAQNLNERPIPRDDFFFTSYDTKRFTEPPTGDAILPDAGYSMKIRVQGPQIIVPEFCITSTSTASTYLRPGTLSSIFRPNGTSIYVRP